MAKKGYSFGALVDFVESLQWKTNWAVPVGAILPFPKEPLPVGFLKLDGSRFDKDVYKDLFEFLGTDVLPNFTNLTPKMIGSDLAASQIKGWEWPEHNHSASSHSHTHTRGTQEISGFVRVISETYAASGQAGGAFAKTESIIGNGTPSNVDATSSGSFDFYASRNWTGATSSDSHGHTIGMAGNSTKVEVDRIGVIYAIKAYGHVEEGYEIEFASLIASIKKVSDRAEQISERTEQIGNLGINKVTDLGTNVDLNNYKTAGFFAQNANINATNGQNYPEPLAGTLLVQDAGVDITTQLYSIYGKNEVWIRFRYLDRWQGWSRMFSSNNMTFEY